MASAGRWLVIQEPATVYTSPNLESRALGVVPAGSVLRVTKVTLVGPKADKNAWGQLDDCERVHLESDAPEAWVCAAHTWRGA